MILFVGCSWSRSLIILFEINEFIHGPYFNKKIWNKLFNLLLTFTVTKFRWIANIKIDIDIWEFDREPVIIHAKHSFILKVRTDERLILPRLKISNAHCVVAEIILCAPFYRNSFSCSIFPNVIVVIYLFKIYIYIFKYFLNAVICPYHTSTYPAKYKYVCFIIIYSS